MKNHLFSELDVHENERICWSSTTNFRKFSPFREEIQFAREELNWRGSATIDFSPGYNCLLCGVRIVADSSKLSTESPLKRPAGMAFLISEEEEFLCEMAQSGKGKKMSNDGDGSRIATSTGGCY